MTFDEAHRCIKRGDLLSLNRALDDGLDPNLANRFAWTLLMLAAMEGNTRAGEVLFAKGAKINAANDIGDTALSLAAHAGQVKFTRWLLLIGASTDCRPHGHDMATWIKMSSGLPGDKLAKVLSLIGYKGHLH
ncbi:ankyrin repeat domain-containing protein [Mesorhizobium sp. ORM8.1]